MFRHRGNTRTYAHNLKIASLLSFVAGIVNVAGFLSIQRLTTNVTGHFAFFIDELFKLNFSQGFIYFLYTFFFLLGSFVSNFIAEITSKKNENYAFVIPTSIEAIILLGAAFSGSILSKYHSELLAFSLLFAMGMQNSLVTTISNSVVRTTHLTGLFTDLGIELSQLIIYRKHEAKHKLISSIKLRLFIINFFFLGGLLSGILYSKINLFVLALASLILLGGMLYDYLKDKE